MICLICRQAEIVDGVTSVKFERDEIRLVVNNVPALICPRCGEAYVGKAVAAHLLYSAEVISKAGRLEEVLDYKELDLK